MGAMLDEIQLRVTGRPNLPDSSLLEGVYSRREERRAQEGIVRDVPHSREFLLHILQEDEERNAGRGSGSQSVSSRKSSYGSKLTALQKEVLSLGATVSKIKLKPTWEGMRFVRQRKGAVDQKASQLYQAWEEFLATATEAQLESPEHQQGQYAVLRSSLRG